MISSRGHLLRVRGSKGIGHPHDWWRGKGRQGCGKASQWRQKGRLIGGCQQGEAGSRLTRSRASQSRFMRAELAFLTWKLALTKPDHLWLITAEVVVWLSGLTAADHGSAFYCLEESDQCPIICLFSSGCHKYSTNICFIANMYNAFLLKIIYLISF